MAIVVVAGMATTPVISGTECCNSDGGSKRRISSSVSWMSITDAQRSRYGYAACRLKSQFLGDGVLGYSAVIDSKSGSGVVIRRACWQVRLVSATQTSPKAPDFKHRLAKESLWMDGLHNPTWAAQDMPKLLKTGNESSAIMGTHKAPKDMKPNNSSGSDFNWRMLSLEKALACLEAGMLPPPSDDDFACILNKCRKERNHASVLRLHAYMHKNGLAAHALLGNHLVSMLVEVGSMSDAQQVFDSLLFQNECSWNSLIVGYVKYGEPQHALILYQRMQEDDSLHPTGHTFVALLKACAKLKELKKGRELHAEIARKGLLKKDPFVGSTLVDMYAKCGFLAKAQDVFDKLPVRDVVSWNALIAGYARHDHGNTALNCFEQMRLEGIAPNAITFVCTLKACGSVGATKKGQKIHAEIAKTGLLQKHLVVGNALVDMYAKCGLLVKAHEVFDQLPVRDVVSWNSLLAGYSKQEQGEEALNCFEQMQHEGISPDAITFICSLKACGSIGATDKGQQIHEEIAKKGLLQRNLVVGNALVDMYAKCGMLAKAQEVFDKLPVRDVISWNSLIAGYIKHECGEEALNCFEQMQHEGISPNAVTFVSSLKACSSIGAIDKGLKVHSEIARKGLVRDLLLDSTLVDMYAKCGLLAEAQEVFDKLSVQDVVSWTALIAGYAEHGYCEEALNRFEQMQHEGISPDAVTFVCSLKACGSLGATEKGRELHAEIARKGIETDLLVGSTLVDMYGKCGLLVKAQEVFDKLPVREIVSWTALIAGYAEHGQGEEALICFEQMQQEGISPNAVTYVSILKACGIIGAIDKGQEIHDEIRKKGLLETDFVVGNALVDMYAKCGLPAKAQEVFDKLPVQEVVSWNALIAGYAQQGESENVFLTFDRMIGEGIKPSLVTFVSVLNACSHAGLVDNGQVYFEAMSKDHGVIPTLEHYTCMIDLLCRAGQLDKVVGMIKSMPIHPDLVVWHTVLGACQKWRNVELGKLAFEYALRLDETDTAAYICMSNIYADADMQENVNMIEAMRIKNQRLKKP